MEINEGKNVTEVLAAVTQGSNEVGVVYATDAASVADQVEIIAEASSDMLETPVLYPVGMIEDEEALPEEKVAAETFFEYLQTENALKVFEEHGFSPYTAEVEDTQADQKTDSEAEETGEASTEQEKTAE